MGNLRIGCIADDFTGATDAASFLRKGGLRTVLVNGGVPCCFPPDTEALVVALKIRSIPPEEACRQAQLAARQLLQNGAERLYYKYCSTFDSTPRGNIGPVTDCLMELLDCPYTILCPALPVNGRTVQEGILYVNGVPLDRSPMRAHPVNPMWDARIERLMAPQSRYPCVTLRVDDWRAGELDARMAAAARGGHVTAAVDYWEDGHGAALAARFRDAPLLTGGSGLLEHLARALARPDRAEAPALPPPRGGRPRLLLAGSCSDMTQRQVRTYLEAGGHAMRIVPRALLAGEQTADIWMDAIAAAREDLLLYSTAPQEERCCSGPEISALLEHLMGRLAVWGRECGYSRIVVAGGETAGAVIRDLGLTAWEIGPEAAPGVPEVMPLEDPGLRLVLKSGNFGDERFFLTALTTPKEQAAGAPR